MVSKIDKNEWKSMYVRISHQFIYAVQFIILKNNDINMIFDTISFQFLKVNCKF